MTDSGNWRGWCTSKNRCPNRLGYGIRHEVREGCAPQMTDSGNDFDDLLKYKLIREMTKDELIAEMNESWTAELMKQDISHLKQQVIGLRLNTVKDRMLNEAGLKKEAGFLGFPRYVEDD